MCAIDDFVWCGGGGHPLKDAAAGQEAIPPSVEYPNGRREWLLIEALPWQNITLVLNGIKKSIPFDFYIKDFLPDPGFFRIPMKV